MALLQLEDKKAIVQEVAAVASSAMSAVLADYRGLTVAEMTELRQKARQTDVYLKVVRNTLARLAVKETQYACLQEVLVGPIVLMFAKSDPGAAARLVRDFSKDHEKLEVKALALDGKLLALEKLKDIAKLPTREEALALLMSVMIAPITKLARTTSETYAKLVRVTAAVRDQKQQAK